MTLHTVTVVVDAKIPGDAGYASTEQRVIDYTNDLADRFVNGPGVRPEARIDSRALTGGLREITLTGEVEVETIDEQAAKAAAQRAWQAWHDETVRILRDAIDDRLNVTIQRRDNTYVDAHAEVSFAAAVPGYTGSAATDEQAVEVYTAQLANALLLVEGTEENTLDAKSEPLDGNQRVFTFNVHAQLSGEGLPTAEERKEAARRLDIATEGMRDRVLAASGTAEKAKKFTVAIGRQSAVAARQIPGTVHLRGALR